MTREDKQKYEYIALLAFKVALGIIAVYTLVKNISFFAPVFIALKPIIYGAVFAYLMMPTYNRLISFFENLKYFQKFTDDKRKSISKTISVTITLLIFILIITAFFTILIPGLYDSTSSLISNLSQNSAQYSASLGNFLANIEKTFKVDLGNLDDILIQYSQNALTNFTQIMEAIYSNLKLSSADTFIDTSNIAKIFSGAQKLFGSALSFIIQVSYFLIGIIAMIYILSEKNSIIDFFKKLTYALFSKKTADKIIEEFAFANAAFKNFIVGKTIDSAIVALICYIFCLIARIPYPLLVSIVIGITNIIPFVGPFIGAILSLILVISGGLIKIIIFIVFVLVLQQVDGNIIGPRILGSSTGISSLGVLVSILIFGSLFGFVGMIIGVPCWAIVVHLITDFINNNKKALK